MGVIEDLVARVEQLEKQVREGGLDGYVNQENSPIGPKRHCRLVRRLVSEGDDRAAIVGGRTFLLSRAALKEELHRGVSPSISSGKSSTEDDEFYRDLMNEVGGN